MDHEQATRIVAESHRILAEGRLRIERQQAIIERLEQLGVDAAKQRALLTIMLKQQTQKEERAVEALDWLQANPGTRTQPLATTSPHGDVTSR